MKKIFVLVNKYPNKIEPNVCVFIQQLVWSFSDMGYECNVICPLPVNLNKKYLKFPFIREEKNNNGKIIKIFHPKYVSYGQSGSFFQKLRVKLTTHNYVKAVDKVLKKQKLSKTDDILYSHFICPSGVAAALLSKKYGIKSYMAHGESIYAGDSKYGNKYLKSVFNYLSGVIAVSTQNKEYLINAKVMSKDKIEVFPNGYNKDRFYKMDKKNARNHFGWNNHDFIVGFCGSFDDRKGVLRLEKAINLINDDKTIKFACAGKGKDMPTSKKCILKEPINNNELVYFYNAIDVFCLPTQNEGCCNAIVEAMACGCPIISSDRSFNYDILDDSNSILIDPNNIDEINNAIIKLFENENKKEKMSNNSLIKSAGLTLEKRAKKILEFID